MAKTHVRPRTWTRTSTEDPDGVYDSLSPDRMHMLAGDVPMLERIIGDVIPASNTEVDHPRRHERYVFGPSQVGRFP